MLSGDEYIHLSIEIGHWPLVQYSTVTGFNSFAENIVTDGIRNQSFDPLMIKET